ncbi:MAG TPA: hypothetical protein DIU15_06480, partial [Deltaproteobacteria bacterium]|nr:hypothetical protein [Deltaproteobacteria bacterium]
GKPLWEARLECIAAVKAIDALLEQCGRVLAPIPHPSAQGTLRRRPMGTIAVVTPFPYPIFIPLQLLLPCLIGGNAVVWKPSSLVPLCSQKVAETFDAAGIPRGVFSMVTGPRDPVGEALVHHKNVDMIVGAGSTALGDAVRVDTEKPVWAQTGGKGWAIVCEDADLDRAAYEVITSAFLTAGQRCNATSRVLVEDAVSETFLKRLLALCRELKIMAPTDPECFSGPLVSQDARTRFQEHLRAYAEADVECLAGSLTGSAELPESMRRFGQGYVQPVVVRLDDGLPPDLTLPEEIEGPLLVTTVVERAEEAVAAYNAHPFGLAASVFSQSSSRADDLTRNLRAGCVNWNRGTIVASARYPNAGLGRSGQGAEGNAALLLACTWPQAKLSASGPFDPSHRVPGINWPAEMELADPTEAVTPPFRPGDDTRIFPVDD